jgi:hypothetical protein
LSGTLELPNPPTDWLLVASPPVEVPEVEKVISKYHCLFVSPEVWLVVERTKPNAARALPVAVHPSALTVIDGSLLAGVASHLVAEQVLPAAVIVVSSR